MSNKFNVKKLAIIGLMAAVVYIATNFRIDIPTPLGKTMLHFGNVMCILSGLLFGGIIGGLSAGIGSAFFDLLDPTFAPEFMITFFMKFVLGFVAGYISHKNNNEDNQKQNIVAAVLASLTYVVLYISKTFITNYIIIGEHLSAVLSVVYVKGSVSLINGLIAVFVSLILAKAIKPRLEKAKILKNI